VFKQEQDWTHLGNDREDADGGYEERHVLLREVHHQPQIHKETGVLKRKHTVSMTI
jgi:hypothetical protein